MCFLDLIFSIAKLTIQNIYLGVKSFQIYKKNSQFFGHRCCESGAGMTGTKMAHSQSKLLKKKHITYNIRI